MPVDQPAASYELLAALVASLRAELAVAQATVEQLRAELAAAQAGSERLRVEQARATLAIV